MNETLKRILNLNSSKGNSDKTLELELKLKPKTVNNWKRGLSEGYMKMLPQLADYFDVSVDYLLGRTENEQSDVSKDKFPSEEIYYIPVIATVAAGFNQNIVSSDWNEVLEVPASIVRGYNKKDLFVFVVSGDSMYPKFLPNDRVLVVRTESVDSGDIAIVSYADYEDGTIKKVVYEPDCKYIDLIPLNPKYSPVRLYGDQLDGFRICGKVIYLFRAI